MSIERIGLLGNPQLSDIASAASSIRAFCEKHSVEVLLSRTLARLVGEFGSGLPARDLVRRSDLIMALGGDGTMLRAARVIGTAATRADKPLPLAAQVNKLGGERIELVYCYQCLGRSHDNDKKGENHYHGHQRWRYDPETTGRFVQAAPA